MKTDTSENSLETNYAEWRKISKRLTEKTILPKTNLQSSACSRCHLTNFFTKRSNTKGLLLLSAVLLRSTLKRCRLKTSRNLKRSFVDIQSPTKEISVAATTTERTSTETLLWLVAWGSCEQRRGLAPVCGAERNPLRGRGERTDTCPSG